MKRAVCSYKKMGTRGTIFCVVHSASYLVHRNFTFSVRGVIFLRGEPCWKGFGRGGFLVVTIYATDY